MSARKRRDKRQKNIKPKIGRIKKILLLLLAAFIVTTLLKTKFWEEDKRLILTVYSSDNIVLLVFDNTASEIYSILVPNETEMDVSYGLGMWRVGSLWQLGINEGMGGRLLSSTITKNLKIPTFLWADKEALGFASRDTIKIIKAIIFPYETNLGLGDKLRLGVFSLKVKNLNRGVVDLSQTTLLYKKSENKKVVFAVAEKLPERLLPLISDPLMSTVSLKALIIDATGVTGVAEDAGQVIEVMGAKVASVERVEEQAFDCRVKSKSKDIATRVSQVFSCEVNDGNPKGNFDIEFAIGSEFARRY